MKKAPDNFQYALIHSIIVPQVSRNKVPDCTNSCVGPDACSKLNFKEDPAKYDACDKKSMCCGSNCQEGPHLTQYSHLKIKSEHRDRYEHDERTPRYGPDFNELMDESTNELEMEMSEEAHLEQHCDGLSRAKEENNNKIDHSDIKDHNLFSSSRLLGGSSKPSSGSAFHPVTSDKELSAKSNIDLSSSVAMSPLGPYPPVGATFVGYPDAGAITSSEKEVPHPLASDKATAASICVLQPKPRLKVNEKPEEAPASVISAGERRSVDSPDAMHKEYTILQPANSTSKVNPSPLRSISVDTPTTTTANVPLATTFEPAESPQSEAPAKHLLESPRYTEQLSGSLSKGKDQ